MCKLVRWPSVLGLANQQLAQMTHYECSPWGNCNGQWLQQQLLAQQVNMSSLQRLLCCTQLCVVSAMPFSNNITEDTSHDGRHTHQHSGKHIRKIEDCSKCPGFMQTAGKHSKLTFGPSPAADPTVGLRTGAWEGPRHTPLLAYNYICMTVNFA